MRRLSTPIFLASGGHCTRSDLILHRFALQVMDRPCRFSERTRLDRIFFHELSVRRHKRLPLLPLNQKAENVECRRETGGVGSAAGIGS